MKIKKDKVFILVMTIVAAGLGYQAIIRALSLINNVTSWRDWIILAVDGFAIYYVLVLLNNNRKRARILKQNQEKKNKDLDTCQK